MSAVAVAQGPPADAAPIVTGSVAFTLPDPDHVPESIAWDSAGNRWLVGSLAKRKVIQIALDGTASDFITDTTLLRVVGMHIDAARSQLWIATWAPRAGDRGGYETRLFKCDRATGRILRRYEPSDADGEHLFNDLAIAANGDVYITDTVRGWIWRVRADSLEVFVRPPADRFRGANGITFSGDERALYAAYASGIARVDVQTGAVELLAAEPGGAAFVDGLYWHTGGLIGVQHAPGPEQVARFELTADGRAIARVRVLERGAAIMRLPTTGAIRGDRFFYVANSEYGRLGRDGRVRPADGEPTRSTIRVVPLPKP